MATFACGSGRNGNQVVAGAGWRAVFRDGRFTTDSEFVANGLRRFAARFPEYQITEIPEDTEVTTVPPPGSDDTRAEETSSAAQPARSRARRGRGAAASTSDDEPAEAPIEDIPEQVIEVTTESELVIEDGVGQLVEADEA